MGLGLSNFESETVVKTMEVTTENKSVEKEKTEYVTAVNEVVKVF